MKKLMIFAAAAVLLTGCVDPNGPDRNRTRDGAVVGAVAGGLLGALTGDDAKERRQRATVGVLAGGVAGGVIGAQLDRQEAQLRADLQGTGVTVNRTPQGISLALPGDITFATNSTAVEPQFQPVLDRVAATLRAYPATRVTVIGHTDNRGSFQYNQQLSESRALSVASRLSFAGVDRSRIATFGRSFSQPVADNGTEAGRRANRRVDILIQPTG